MEFGVVHGQGLRCQTDAMSSEFWDRLTTAFTEANLEISQSAVARQLGVGQSAVAKWAHGSGYPTLRKCIQIAQLAGVNTEWLMTGRGNKNQNGGDMDELTQRMLESWAELPASAKREVMAFVQFKASEPPQNPPPPEPTRK